MASKAPSLDLIHKWLQHVDEQISPGECVDFLKLALYPFLRIDYATAQVLITPSEVYNFLLEKCFQSNKKKAFQWFTHALSLLSGDLSGDYLVSVKCLSHYGISSPSAPAADKMEPESKFFNCLTTIARKAREYNLEVGLKQRFAKKHFLNVNPRHMKHLPDLFIRLVQNQIIAPTNTYHLLRALLKLRSKKSVQCLVYLNDYHKSVGLDEIEEVKGIEKDPQTTIYENADRETSSDYSAVVPRRVNISCNRQRCENKVNNREGDIMDESLKILDWSEVEPEISISVSEISSNLEDCTVLITTPRASHTRHYKLGIAIINRVIISLMIISLVTISVVTCIRNDTGRKDLTEKVGNFAMEQGEEVKVQGFDREMVQHHTSINGHNSKAYSLSSPMSHPTMRWKPHIPCLSYYVDSFDRSTSSIAVEESSSILMNMKVKNTLTSITKNDPQNPVSSVFDLKRSIKEHVDSLNAEQNEGDEKHPPDRTKCSSRCYATKFRPQDFVNRAYVYAVQNEGDKKQPPDKSKMTEIVLSMKLRSIQEPCETSMHCLMPCINCAVDSVATSSLCTTHLVCGLCLANLLASHPGLRPWSWAEHSSES